MDNNVATSTLERMAAMKILGLETSELATTTLIAMACVQVIEGGISPGTNFSYPIITSFNASFLPKKAENERINITLAIQNQSLFDKATITIDYSGGWISLDVEKDETGYYILSPMDFSTLSSRTYTLSIEFRDTRMIKYDSDLVQTFEA